MITAPKTEQSVRVIELPGFLTQEIKEYVDKLYELPDDERIFPIVAEALQHKLKRQAEKAGVKKLRVHDDRHSSVANLINQGVQPLIIKERLGHKDIKITLNTYGHLYPNQQRQVANMLNQQKKALTAATVRTYDNWKTSVISNHNTSITEVSSNDNNFLAMGRRKFTVGIIGAETARCVSSLVILLSCFCVIPFLLRKNLICLPIAIIKPPL